MEQAPSVRFGDARRIARPVLCLVTPGTSGQRGDREDQGRDDVVELAARASGAGVDVVQLREPDLPDNALLNLLRRVRGAVDRSRTAVLVNDRMDIALAAGADGVHLRADAMRGSHVRSMAPAGFVIGRSVHSVEEARDAEQDGGVDYLIFGTVFPSASKPADHPIAGLETLSRVCSTVALPVLAIGGLNPERAADAAAAGAAGIAAIGIFADAAGNPNNLHARVRQMRHAFDTR